MAELLQFPFARGMDEGADPKGLPPGQPTSLENCYHDKLGRVVKRPGITALSTDILGGGSVSEGVRLITRGDTIAVFDGTSIYSWIAALSKWKAVDRPPALHVTTTPLLDTTRSVFAIDFAVSGRLLVLAYQVGTSVSGNPLYVEVIDTATRQIVMPATRADSAGCFPRVLINQAGTKAYVLWSNGSGQIWLGSVDLATLAFTAHSALTATVRNSSAFDALLANDGTAERVYLAYETSAGAARFQLQTFSLTTFLGVNSSGPHAMTGNNDTKIALTTNGTNVHAIYSCGTDALTRLVTTNMALGAAVGPTTLEAVTSNLGVAVAVHDSGDVLTCWSYDAGSTQSSVLTTERRSPTTHAATASSGRLTYNVAWPCKPFQVDGRWYTTVTTYVHQLTGSPNMIPPGPSTIVLELETANSLSSISTGPAAHSGTLQNGTGWYSTGLLKTSTAADGTVYAISAFRNREVGVSIDAILPAGWSLHAITAATGIPNASALNGALIPGAVPLWWDGVAALPYGFAHQPMILAVTATAGAGLVAGVYGYQATYLYRDANGLGHRSIPSDVVTGTASGGNLQLTVRFATSSASGKGRGALSVNVAAPVAVELWRSEVDQGVYYYHPSALTINSPVVGSDTFVDSYSDATLNHDELPQVYTATGELDNAPPPASIAALAHTNRFWLLASDGHTLWASKSFTDDPSVAPGFNEALTLYFAADKSAIGALDDAVVVLGEDTIDIVAGVGRDKSGNGAWSTRGVQTDLGCTNQRSVAGIPQGLVYQSRRGIELLTRGLEVQWLGEPIRDTLASYPTVTSAVVVSKLRQLRISVQNAGATDGRVLVFDYGRGAWSVWNYGFPVADAAVIDGTYTVLRYNGAVYQESSTSSRDGTTYVAMAVTINITPSGPNAWQRMKHAQLLGTSVTPHTLKMSIKRDWASTYEYEKTFPSATAVTDVQPLESARITPPFQKGQGFVVRIEDSAPDSDDTTDTGKGPIFESLAVSVQRKSGLPRISSERRG